MIFLGLIFLIFYFSIFFLSLNNISKGKFEYLLFFICLCLPFYITLQAQLYFIFHNEILINLLKFSKDLIFLFSFIVILFGIRKSIFLRKFYFSSLDKLISSFVLLVIVYTLIPLGEASFVSKILYAKNLLIIALVYFIGRNIKIDEKNYKSLTLIISFIFYFSFLFVFSEFILSGHFHSKINFSNFNFHINEIEPQGNYGLSWTFESQGAKPRYAAFYSNPLEFSASLLLFLSYFLYYLFNRYKNFDYLPLLLVVICFYLSFSRATILAAILIILFAFIINEKYKTFFQFIFFGLIISLLFYFSASKELKYLIIDTILFENTSSLGHLVEWIEGLISIAENPFGIGLAMSGNANGVDQAIKVGGENQFIILGVQMGLLAILIYSIIIYLIIYKCIFVYKNSHSFDKHLSFIVSCTKFGLLLPLFTANAELYLFVSLSIWFLSGYLESKYINLKFEKNKSLY